VCMCACVCVCVCVFVCVCVKSQLHINNCISSASVWHVLRLAGMRTCVHHAHAGVTWKRRTCHAVAQVRRIYLCSILTLNRAFARCALSLPHERISRSLQTTIFKLTISALNEFLALFSLYCVYVQILHPLYPFSNQILMLRE